MIWHKIRKLLWSVITHNKKKCDLKIFCTLKFNQQSASALFGNWKKSSEKKEYHSFCLQSVHTSYANCDLLPLMAHNAWERATKNCPKWSGTKAKVDLWKLSSDPGSKLLFPEIKATKISFVPLYTIMSPIIYFFDGWSLSTDIFYSASA